MTEHKHPDDGGPSEMPPEIARLKSRIRELERNLDRDRFEAARQFAAAWLPLMPLNHLDYSVSWRAANELGLMMADDLIRRLREGQT